MAAQTERGAKTKVLFVATVDEHIRHFHLPYLQWLHEQGCEVHVASGGNEDFPFCDQKFNLPYRRTPFSLENVRANRLLRRIAAENGYAVIHFHTPVASVFGRWAVRAARRQGTRVFYTAHGFHFFEGARLRNWLLFYPPERLMARWTDVLLTVNGEDYARARRFCAGKGTQVRRIPGIGVSLERFAAAPDPAARLRVREALGIPPDAFVALTVGELIERKNYATALRAVAAAEKICLLCAGRGQLEERLPALAQRLGVRERVRFLGYRTDLPELYAAADAFVFPSWQEGLPVALVEAMASALPCVASDVRGNRDLIRDGLDGILCPPGDARAFAAELLRLRNDAALRRRLGSSAREHVREYSLARAEAAVEAIYREYLPAPREAQEAGREQSAEQAAGAVDR